MQNLVQKWRGNGANERHFFRATATATLFFTLAPPLRAPLFIVRAGKVAQVPSTAIFFTYSTVYTVFFIDRSHSCF